MRKILVAAAAALLLVSACSSESEETTTTAGNAVQKKAPDATTTTAASTTSTKVTTTTHATTTTTQPTSPGTLDDPVPAGSWAGIGNVDAVVLGTLSDATDLVLAENDDNEPPAPGNRFVFWNIAVSNAGQETTPLLSELSFSVVGPSAVAYDSSAHCGVIPDEFDQFRDVFPGGTVEGNLCWEVADGDADDLLLLVDEFAFSSERVVFAPATSATPITVDYPTPVPVASGGPIGSRGNPHPIGTTISVGDWDIAVTGKVADATADVLAENTFNDPPEDDRVFLVVGIEATYTGETSDLLAVSTSFNVVGPLAVAYTGEDACGVVPGELDAFTEVFPGGTVEGNLCWSVQDEDVDGLVLYSQGSFDFDGEPQFFGLE